MPKNMQVRCVLRIQPVFNQRFLKIDKFDKGIISEYELTSLVSNMLQNAIEGAE